MKTKAGLEGGLKIMIESLKELNVAKEKVIQKVTEKHTITMEESTAKVSSYW